MYFSAFGVQTIDLKFDTPYKIEEFYEETREKDFVAAAVRKVQEIHSTQPQGSVLVFLPGRADIEEAYSKLSKDTSLHVLRLYSSGPEKDKEEAVKEQADTKRKIILATSVAE